MTEGDFKAAVAAGKVEYIQPDSETESESSVLPTTSIEQFIPLLTQLQSVQQCLTAAPTAVPQSFQEQIQFVYTGGHYYLYLYFNNQWNQFSITGGSGVTQILAGTGISISPAGGTGAVTITNTGITSLTAGAGISVTGSTITNAGVTKIIAGSNISISSTGVGGTGDVTVNASISPGTRKVGFNTRSLGASSGSQTIAHGLGTTPTLVRITSNYANSTSGGGGIVGSCYGTYDGTNTYGCYSVIFSGSGVNTGLSGDVVTAVGSNGTDGQTATITVDATNIYFTWNKGGVGLTGNVNFVWEAIA